MKQLLAIGSIFCIFSLQTLASTPDSSPIKSSTAEIALTSTQKEQLVKIDKLYSQYSVIKSKFIQKDSLGNTAQGWFALQKPGKLRIEYEDIPIRFIATSGNLMYQDIKLKQKSFIPIKTTPFYYLLGTQNSFLNNSIMITKFNIAEDYIEVSFVSRESPAMGSLTVYVTKDKAQIIKWTILDSKGISTDIFLNNPVFSNTPIKNSSIFNVQRVKDMSFSELE